ncbi:hypothetical protein [Defluviimonas salinarum]|uniref:Flagellar FliJ protein n=1 Tax=Defluviimonas salinarum TaxID=2992147 RepID=A0ABT3J3R4_9RHOB|nr:hypothetical protein [Defluviimonas salinarum]MCW3782034.1 hypothetical protein [Defluviimonas salinarum]
MSGAGRLAALARLATLKKEANQMALSAAGARRAAIEARLRALDQAETEAWCAAERSEDAGTLVAQQAFARLMAARRTVLGGELERATEAWQTARAAAARSFGQSTVLDRLLAEARIGTSMRRRDR